MGREPAHRVRGPRIAGEAKRLAATAAPVLLMPPQRARAARLLHPLGPAAARERVRLVPDPVERVVADAFARFRGTEWMQEPCRSCPLGRQEEDWGGCRCQ